MMWCNDSYVDEINVRDGVYGEVTGKCKNGIFLKLFNGQEAFAFFGGLEPGTKVFCTVLKKAKDKLKILVGIDSVIKEEIFVSYRG